MALETIKNPISKEYTQVHATDTLTIAAVAGKNIKILGLSISAAGAGNYAITTGSEAIMTYFLAANSHIDRLSNNAVPLFQGDEGENVVITIGGSPTTPHIYVKYIIE